MPLSDLRALRELPAPGVADEAENSLLTIGVDDLERSLNFYCDGLGLARKDIVGREFEHGAVVFFDLQDGLKLALWPREDIAHDAALPKVATEFTIGHNVQSKEEVDSVMAQAEKAGARIVKRPAPTFWGGYAGYFRTPTAASGKSPGTHRLPED